MIFKLKHINDFIEINTELIQDIKFKKLVDKEVSRVFSDFHKIIEKSSSPIFRFYFVNNFNKIWDNSSNFQSMGNAHYYNGVFKLNAHGAYIILDTNEDIPTIYFLIKNKIKKDFLYKIKNSNFSSYVETQINTFYYRVFLIFMQWCNLTQKTTFIHASSVAYKDNAYLLSATSGIGKSSFLMAISKNHEFSFIADDLTILKSNGKAFFLGRKMSVKPYHLIYFPWLNDLLKRKMGLMHRLQWKLFSKSKNLIFGLPISSLFKSKPKTGIKVKKIFHLINHHKNNFESIHLSSSDLSRISNAILQTEMFLGLEFFSQINYFNVETRFSTDSKFGSDTRIILENILQSIEVEGILVPYRSDPNDLAAFIKKRINNS